MIKSSLKLLLIGGAITLALAIYTFIIFPTLPDVIPTHWGIDGKADRFEPKGSGAFISLWIMLGMIVLFTVLPFLSPKTKPIEEFRGTYDTICLIIFALVGYIHVITLQGALGTIRVDHAIVLGMLAMFGLMGNVLGRVKPNYFMGVRTPWTLESPLVWEKTHRLAGRLTVATSVLGIVLLLAGVHPLVCVFIGITGLVIPVPYSFIVYKKTTSP